MAYEWKLPGLYPVPAQTAGEELDRIYQEHGGIEAKTIVDESRPESAPLHPCFEWRDPVAAEMWREHQARGIVQCIVTTSETKKGDPVEVRAFVHVADTYRPTSVVLESHDMRRELEESALRDMVVFKKRYSTLASLKPVLKAMGEAIHAVEKSIGSGQGGSYGQYI